MSTQNKEQVMVDLFKSMAKGDTSSREAAVEFAQAVETPLREVVLTGDNLSNIFVPEDRTDGSEPKYFLDLIQASQEKEFVAFVYPGEGRIPEKRVTSDYVMVPTYDLANAIDIKRTHARDARWNVIGRMMQILEAGIVAKRNDEGWATLLTAARDRGIVVSDPNAVAGQFTPRLITALSTIMRRQGGGNSGSKNRNKLTDVYMSPEAHMDIRSWNIVDVPDEIRTQIWNDAGNGDTMNVYGVNLHALDEFGEGQEYQQYYTSVLGGGMAGGDLEIVIGLDRQQSDTFIMPYKENLTVREDLTADRHGLISFYARMNMGFAVLDSRKILVGSI